MTTASLPAREITSEVLLKLDNQILPHLPMACKTCPSAMWQLTGKPNRPESVTARCYCPVMHTFTWDSQNQEEILDCDRLYQEEEEDEDGRPPANEQVDESQLPPFLQQQRQREREQMELAGLEHDHE